MTTPTSYTVAEAALRFRLPRTVVTDWARRGRVDAVLVGRRWVVDGAFVEAYKRRQRRRGDGPGRRGPLRYVSAGPLLRQLELAGGWYAAGVQWRSPEERALCRAQASGRLTEEMADHLAVRLLGLTLWEIAG